MRELDHYTIRQSVCAFVARTETMNSQRAENEIRHAQTLIQSDPESIWGWGTAAGRVRARRRAQLIATGARLEPGLRVLEIGCGTGLFTEMFAQSGAQLVAVDISSALLERARARGLSPDKVQFLEKQFEDCDVDGPFDAVIGSSVLHHLDIEVALRKIHDVLKPCGVMCFAEPNMLNPQILVQKNVSWVKNRLGDSPDETAFVRWSLRRLLSGAGFRGILIKPFDWLHPLTPSLLISIVTSAGRVLEETPIVREFAGSLLIQCHRP